MGIGDWWDSPIVHFCPLPPPSNTIPTCGQQEEHMDTHQCERSTHVREVPHSSLYIKTTASLTWGRIKVRNSELHCKMIKCLAYNEPVTHLVWVIYVPTNVYTVWKLGLWWCWHFINDDILFFSCTFSYFHLIVFWRYNSIARYRLRIIHNLGTFHWLTQQNSFHSFISLLKSLQAKKMMTR